MACDLLGEGGLQFVLAHLAHHQHHAAGTDRGENQTALADDRRPARGEISTPARLISATFSRQPMPGEDEAVGPEGVGQNHPAAGLDVAAGDLFDLFGLREVPGVGACADRQSPLLKLRAQGARRSPPARRRAVWQWLGAWVTPNVCAKVYVIF